MNAVAIAALVIEIAAGAALQASGFGGPMAVAGSAAVLVGTVVVLLLVLRTRRRSLARAVRAFLARRSAMTPPQGDPARVGYDADTVECYRVVLGPDVKDCAGYLREKGIIGSIEEQRLANPKDVVDLEWIADRLAKAEAQLR